MARRRGKFHRGFYTVINTQKYLGDLTKVEYRSGWEQFFMRWLDLNPNVEKWNSEGIVINYFSKYENKQRRYFVDFYVKYVDGKQFIYEVKPYKQSIPPVVPKKQTPKSINRFKKEYETWNINLDKWCSANDSANLSGMKFKIITEKDLTKIGMKL